MPATVFRRLASLLGCALFLGLAWQNAASLPAIWRVLARAQTFPLLLALAFQAVALLNQPALWHSLYALVDLPAKWRDLVAVVWAGRFVNVAAPAAGLGETALLFDQARRRGWDVAGVALATTLFFALNFAVFAAILVAGFALLLARGELKSFELAAALPLFAGLLIGALLLRQIGREPDVFSAHWPRWAARLPSRLQKRLPPSQVVAAKARSYAMSLAALPDARGRWARPALHAILVDALEIAVFAACLRAFDVPASPALLVAAYAVGTLFTVVSLTPQGVGAVEGALGATLISFGVPLISASAVVVAYRGLSFWLPLGVGFAATRVWSKTLRPEIADSAPLPMISRRS